jgi:protein TonB
MTAAAGSIDAWDAPVNGTARARDATPEVLPPVVRLPRSGRGLVVATLVASCAAHAAVLGFVPDWRAPGAPPPSEITVTLVAPPPLPPPAPVVRAPEPPAPPVRPRPERRVETPRAAPRASEPAATPPERMAERPPEPVVTPTPTPSANLAPVPLPVEAAPRAPTPPAVQRPVEPAPASAQPSLALAAPAAAPAAPPAPSQRIEPPSFGLAYLNNPPPEYPAAARRMQLEGTVLVRVLVGVDGDPRELSVARTSGAPVLDEAALRAIRRWRFVPARRGDTPIAHWAEVPVQFRLQD